MKQLQNNFTTPEQSKRLLELGVPADSADMFYFAIGNSKENYDRGIFYETPDVLKPGNIFHELTKNTFPCWSVGRLIEICLKCSTLEQRQCRFFCNGDDDEYSLIDYIVTVLESGVMTNHMDFSKL